MFYKTIEDMNSQNEILKNKFDQSINNATKYEQL